jgi:acetyltransferase-like isoleucine patch superfamily enzyme
MLQTIINKIKLHRLGSIQYARNLGVQIGEGCKFISYPDFGSEPYLISIGNHVEICSNVTFLTHDGATWVFRNNEKYKDVIRYGRIIIEDNCFIGKGSTILPGVKIGKNSIVGACSLVTKDVAPRTIVGGVPAHLINSVEAYAEKCFRETPEYSIDEYHKDKESVLKRIY